MAEANCSGAARVTRLPLLLMAVVVAVLLAGCTSNDESRSNTPQFTVDPTSSTSPTLLTEAEVEDIVGLSDVVAQDIADVPLFENPDPRGPCGGVAPDPPLDGAVGRAFSSGSFLLIEFLAPADADADEYLATIAADLERDECGTYQSMTNVGTPQTVSQIEAVELGPALHTGTAWTSHIQSGGSGGFVGVAVAQAGERLVFLQAQASSPMEPSVLRALVEEAASKLAA